MKRVLVLGAGLVVKPLLDELLSDPEIDLHLATLNIARARHLLAGRPRGTALEVNAADQQRLRAEVRHAHAVVSLLPAEQHVLIANACLECGVPLVTTSYVSEAMRAIDALARERGVLLLNECGLDPGIDHMTAMALVRRVQQEGGAVVAFASYCGGLPAPDSNNNPWGYKFAWSPRGVVVATRNHVRYLLGGRIVDQKFPEYFEHPFAVEVPGVSRLESYPNRDCLRYIEPYGVHGIRDFFRGTLRYPGWCQTWHALHRLGLLDPKQILVSGATFARLLESQLAPGAGSLRARIAAHLHLPPEHAVLERLEWLGLFSEELVAQDSASALDVLVSRLQQKLAYAPGERDAVVLEHRLTYQREGACRTRFLRLVLEGQAGDDSAMARTVSIPAALACRLLLAGRVTLSGVRIPTEEQLAGPILAGLAERGIHFSEEERPAPAP